MRLFLLDRDGVVVVNRRDNIKSAAQLQLIAGSAEAIARLNKAGYTVAICTNQPEVSRGAMSFTQLQEVHKALQALLREKDALVDRIFCCTSIRKCPRRKPASGMLDEALHHYGVAAFDTPFVGDQVDDLKAAFHAGCRRILVRTGLGHRTLRRGLPAYLRPVEVHDDLAAAVDAELACGQSSSHQSGQLSSLKRVA
jgi:D-glycero-D-manno-heptose 1,7-bisphosphate phosphatase